MTAAPDAQLYLASVAAYNSTQNTCRLLFPGESSASSKYYKCLSSASGLSAGDRVVVMKHSGTYVVIGKIGSSSGGESVNIDTTPSNFVSAGTGVSVTSDSRFATCGKVAMLLLTFKVNSSVSGGSTIATLKSGKRPALFADAQLWAGRGAYINQNGAIIANETLSASSSTLWIFSTFLLA